jgi:hypothetical protein
MNTTDTSESRDFDFKRSECILPARTTVFAYIDPNTGDLRIWACDGAFQCDTELRIAAEDVADFINRLAELVGRPPLLEARKEIPDPRFLSEEAPPLTAAQQANDGDSRPLSGAERARRYRAKQRDENVTQRDAPALLEEPGGVE